MSKEDAAKPSTPNPANQRSREDLQISRKAGDIITAMHGLHSHIRSHGESHPRVIHDAKKIVTLVNRALGSTVDAALDVEITPQGFEYHAINLLAVGDRARDLTTPFLSHGVGRFIIDRQVTDAEIAALLIAITRAAPADRDPFESFFREISDKQVAHIHVYTTEGGSPPPLAPAEAGPDDKTTIIKPPSKSKSKSESKHDTAVGIPAAKKSDHLDDPRHLYLAMIELMKEINAQLALGVEFETRELFELSSALAEIMRDRARYMLPYAMVRRLDRYDVVHPVNACILAAAAAAEIIENHRDRQQLIQSILLMDAGLHATGPLIESAAATVPTDYTGHPIRAAMVLDGISGLTKLPMILAFEQHLQADFTGYPAQPHRWRLNFLTSLVSLAEQLDALTNGRTPLCPNQALAQLATRIGTAVDVEAFDALYAAIGPYPPGSLVELENGEIAVVLRYKVPMRVRMIADASKRLLSDPHTMTASLPGGKPAEGVIVRAIDANTFPISVIDFLA